jgi:RNA polymerase sigma-70 factor (ECF subfamily)
MTDKEFEIIFREQFKPLCNLANTMVKDADAAKDIVQQVFLNYWQIRENLIIRGATKGYLYRAVVNASLNHINKFKRIVPLDSSLTNITADIENDSVNQVEIKVRNAIGALPPICQKVFTLSRYSNLTNKEIAEELEISLKTVEKHISKALKALRISLRPLMSSEFILILTLVLNFLLFQVGFFTFILSIK